MKLMLMPALKKPVKSQKKIRANLPVRNKYYMKRLFSYGLIASVLLASAVYAVEPTNLHSLKVKVANYHDSGEYDKDLQKAMAGAMDYLKRRVAQSTDHSKMAIVLDIDETSLSNFKSMKRLDFGGTLDEIRADEDAGQDPAIEPTLKLYQFAKANNAAVFFITGRFEEERDLTVKNLEKEGFVKWDKLILRDGKYRKVSASEYKTAMRKKLEEEGYDIVLNIGDQQSDLAGGYADKTVKLPNPYYFIP
jgi:acid phosphatase